MKKVKLIMLVVTAMLFFGMESLSAQENSLETVIIRVTETRIMGKPVIVTTDPEGKTSTIKLEKGYDNSGANAALIQKEIGKWKQEGYKITHLSTSDFGSDNDIIFRTTIILEK